MDLVFLDIEMDGTSGMDTARTIRARDSRLLIVFVTGYPDYVFDGYTVRALDYLLKPIQIDKLACVLARAQEQLADDAPKFLPCATPAAYSACPSARSYTFIVTAGWCI